MTCALVAVLYYGCPLEGLESLVDSLIGKAPLLAEELPGDTISSLGRLPSGVNWVCTRCEVEGRADGQFLVCAVYGER